MGQFFKENPGVAVNMSTRIKRFDFAGEFFDAAIYFGEADWPGVRHLKLFEEKLTACASHEMLQKTPISRIEDMVGQPLLYLESRPRAKRLALVFGFATRLQILLLALLAFTASERVAGARVRGHDEHRGARLGDGREHEAHRAAIQAPDADRPLPSEEVPERVPRGSERFPCADGMGRADGRLPRRTDPA